MRDDDNPLDRRRFPAIAWGVVALAVGLLIILILIRAIAPH